MSDKNPSRDFFLSTIHQKAMGFLAKYSDQEFHEREVARRIGISFGSANKALNDLFKSGLLARKRAGNMVFYRFDRQEPLLRILKIYTTLALLRPLIDRLKSTTTRITLFGSCAKGEDDSQSDIDLFIVADDPGNARPIIDEFNFPRAFEDIAIKPVIFSTIDLLRSEKIEPEFLSLVNDGIVLWEWKSHETGILGVPEQQEARSLRSRPKARRKGN